MKNKLYRIADANLNRAREGLRVIEDIVRFIAEDKKMTDQLKRLRHDITNTAGAKIRLLKVRDSENDTGKAYFPVLEGRKKDIKSLTVSNFKRTEESLRVLEEVSKILNPKKAGIYKKLRFRAYTMEKKVYERL